MKLINEKTILIFGLLLLVGQAGWNSFLITHGEKLWWYDMLLHFLGGMMVAMLLLHYAEKWPSFIQLPGNRFVRFVCIVSFVALIGVFWEFYEYAAGYVFRAFDLQLPDTLSDLFFDLAGASVVAAMYEFLKK